MEFGFLVSPRRVVAPDFSLEITPRHDHGQILSHFYDGANVSDGWIYPEVRDVPLSTRESVRFRQRVALVSEQRVSLPSTHSLRIHPFEPLKARFIILAYGFINGVCLAPVGYVHLARVAYEEGRLTGVAPHGEDHEKALGVISQFVSNASATALESMFAILHWFLVGQSYAYEWDRFDAQYKVLDAIFKFSGIQSRSHAQRPVKLASHYGVILPSWAALTGTTSRLSDIRNDLVHEAKYAGRPIGYAHADDNFDLELWHSTQN